MGSIRGSITGESVGSSRVEPSAMSVTKSRPERVKAARAKARSTVYATIPRGGLARALSASPLLGD